MTDKPHSTGRTESRVTVDHDEIRNWVEKHGGKPVSVKKTGSGRDVGILRIDFPGGSGEESLEPISWQEWFEKFEQSNLAFLYQEHKASGEDSTFFKLIHRAEAGPGHGGKKGRA